MKKIGRRASTETLAEEVQVGLSIGKGKTGKTKSLKELSDA